MVWHYPIHLCFLSAHLVKMLLISWSFEKHQRSCVFMLRGRIFHPHALAALSQIASAFHCLHFTYIRVQQNWRAAAQKQCSCCVFSLHAGAGFGETSGLLSARRYKRTKESTRESGEGHGCRGLKGSFLTGDRRRSYRKSEETHD